MQDAADMALLREYVHRNSEEAFAALVTRYVNMVYSAALRKTGNASAAEEITQAVFIILAKKAGRLRDGTILSGWLYQAARLTSASFLRTEIRRVRREQEAYMQSLSNETESEVWPQIAPLLEDAMGKLSEKERNAIALRFFEEKSFQEIGTAVGASENAAKKRVAYALEKLRRFFHKRGVASTTAIIAGVLSANSVQAAPVALAKSVTVAAIAKGVAASGSTSALIKGALKIMAWTKAKTAVVAGVVLVAVTTTGVVGYKLVQAHHSGNRPVSLQSAINDVQTDGTIRFQTTSEIINKTGRALNRASFIDSDFVQLDRLTDESGQPIRFTTQHDGNIFRYAVTLNKPVPPGGKITYTLEGTKTRLIQPTGEPGVYQYRMNHSPEYNGDTHRIEVHRLPAGAVLLEKHPADLAQTVNDGQIELRIDKMIPPGDSLEVSFRYRLPAATKQF
jgi:RNA polymerase sigma factor (sigma-70 family)